MQEILICVAVAVAALAVYLLIILPLSGRVMCRCGHVAPRRSQLTICGETAEYRASLASPCPDCYRETVIPCGCCGRPIVPEGYASLIYFNEENEEIRDDAVRDGEGRPSRLTSY